MRQQTRWPVVTLTLIAACLIAWFAVAWGYQLRPFTRQNSYLLLRVGAVNGELLWAGEWWRITTSQFLHVYFLHLVFNVASLLLLGAALEREFGSIRFALLYLLSGSVGQFSSVVAAPTLVTSGASQAVMGLAGALAVSFLLRRREFGRWQLVVLLTVIGITAVLDIVAAGRLKAGHVGGLCAGAVIGWIISPRAAKA